MIDLAEQYKSKVKDSWELLLSEGNLTGIIENNLRNPNEIIIEGNSVRINIGPDLYLKIKYKESTYGYATQDVIITITRAILRDVNKVMNKMNSAVSNSKIDINKSSNLFMLVLYFTLKMKNKQSRSFSLENIDGLEPILTLIPENLLQQIQHNID